MLLLAAAVLLIAVTAMRTWVRWLNDAGISFASGVMISMAADLKAGVFYRPLLDAHGYGGTRYLPLYFCLHALLLKLGMPVLASAYLLSTIALILLLLGTFQLLRNLGAEPWLAAGSTIALLAAATVQMSLSTPQADGLAAALNVWGLAMIVRLPHSRRQILLAALLFTLAWSAKLTTVFGLATALIWLIATGNKRTARRLGVATSCGYLLVAAIMVVASHGRVVEIFKACASGGTSLAFLARAPLRMWGMAMHTDPSLLLFAVPALAVMFWIFTHGWRDLPALFLLATLLVTAVIFGSPGTTENHLLDVQVASLILLVTWMAKRASSQQARLGVCFLALLMVVSAAYLWRHARSWGRWYHPHQFQRTIKLIGPTKEAILSENPVVPVLAGQRPYVLDPWMIQLLGRRNPNFGVPLLVRLQNHWFSAVVLSTGDPDGKGGRLWYDKECFTPGFVSALDANYRLAQVIDNDWIYLPRINAPRGDDTEYTDVPRGGDVE
jgi:hypothetical protein